MAGRNRSESVTWGLFILALGVLLQAHYLRPEWRILQNLWKFWPVVLIIIGVNKLLRSGAARGQPDGEAPR